MSNIDCVYDEVFEEDIVYSRGPNKKDIEEIEKEFSDVLDEASVDDVSEVDSRFTVEEMKKIDIMWKMLTDNKYRQKKKMEKAIEKDVEKITAEEYLAVFDEKQEESEDLMDMEEVSFDSLNNFDEAREYYEE